MDTPLHLGAMKLVLMDESLGCWVPKTHAQILPRLVTAHYSCGVSLSGEGLPPRFKVLSAHYVVGLGNSCALVARQHFKGSCSALLGHPGAVPNHSNAPETWVSSTLFPAEPVFITKVLPSCPAAPKTQTEVRGKFGGAGRRRWARRRGCTALGGPGLGEKLRRAPSTVHPSAGLGKVSAHGCGHQILVSGRWCCSPGVEQRPVQMYRGKIPSSRSHRAGRAGCLVPPWCCWHRPGGLGWAPQRPLHPRCGYFGQEGCTEAVSAGLEGVCYVRLVKISA